MLTERPKKKKNQTFGAEPLNPLLYDLENGPSFRIPPNLTRKIFFSPTFADLGLPLAATLPPRSFLAGGGDQRRDDGRGRRGVGEAGGGRGGVGRGAAVLRGDGLGRHWPPQGRGCAGGEPGRSHPPPHPRQRRHSLCGVWLR